MKKLPIPVYGGNLIFFTDPGAMHQYHKSRDKDAADHGKPAGLTSTIEGSVDLMIGVFDGKLQTLVHECVHAAMYVFERCEIEPDASTHEPFAYFVDCLYGLLTPYLDPKPAKPKPQPGGPSLPDPIPF